MSVENTCASELALYIGMPKASFAEAQANNTLSPNLFMVPTAGRSWIPMSAASQAALERSHWGAAEVHDSCLGGMDPKTDFCIVHVTFSAQGFGHYYLSGKLTTFDWKSWRFHGDLAFRTTDTEGRLLAEITNVSDIL